MRIDEFTNSPQTYIATVRVVLRDGSTVARTTVAADTYQQARLVLTRIFGEGSVVSLHQSMQESPRTSQIHAHPSNRERSTSCIPRQRQIDSDHFSCVAETGTITRVLSPAELQVKSLSDRASQYNQQAKQLKARQAMQRAQQNLLKASRTVSPR